jgi:hypothetical protein
MDLFSDVAARAVEKFNISTDRLPEALAQFESLTGRGGPKLDELGRKFGMMAGAAAEAGFTGEEGMRTILNIMNQVDDKLESGKSEGALKRFFEVFRVGGKDVKDLEKAMGGKFEKGSGAKEKLEAVLAKGGKARAELEEKLGPDVAVMFNQMIPIFDNTMKEALAAGKTRQEATTLAVEAFDRSITGADKQTRSYADNVKAATDRLKDDPALQLQKAMNKLQEVMTSPQALESIKKLMDVLPPLAEKMAKLLEFILEHPLVSGGLAVGGKLGMSFLGGYGGKMLDNSFPGGGKSGGVMVPPSAEKLKMSGAQIGQGAVGVLAAAGIGYSIGTVISEMITAAGEEISKKQTKILNELSGRGALSKEVSEVAGLDMNTEEGRKRAVEIKKKLESEKSGAVKRLEGEGFWSRFKRDMLSVMSGGGTGGEAFSEETRAITSMQNAIARAEGDAARQAYFDKLMKSADSASKALDKIGGTEPPGPRGPKIPPKSTPGAEPKK